MENTTIHRVSVWRRQSHMATGGARGAQTSEDKKKR
jgi:hypothetical protein